jgi:mannose-1-phosphate guanylyltransferase
MNHSNLWAIVLAGGEGTRVRNFLQHICGGSGIKQFSAILGDRSMLRCTLDRVEPMIPAERILIVVGAHHRKEVEKQLTDWPRHNIIYQPANRDTAAGILLPLAHITARDPEATVVVFPSDHFILDEERFMGAVDKALQGVETNPGKMVLLGMTPQIGEESEYGYIKVGRRRGSDHAKPVAGFVEKPPLPRAKELIQQGALWNTMVFAAHSTTLWDMVKETAPVLYHAFRLIEMTLPSADWRFLEHLYQVIPSMNFSSAICEPLSSRLRVVPVADVGWSDWGSVGSILRTVQKLGRFDDLFARLERTRIEQASYAFPRFGNSAEPTDSWSLSAPDSILTLAR